MELFAWAVAVELCAAGFVESRAKLEYADESSTLAERDRLMGSGWGVGVGGLTCCGVIWGGG